MSSEHTGATQESEKAAVSIVLSYPADLSEWGRQQVSTPHFRAYLRKAHDTAEMGDTWAEFVGVGCCGDNLDVPLRVEGVEGGSQLTEATSIEYEVRDSCEVQGGWRVQSAGGPTE